MFSLLDWGNTEQSKRLSMLASVVLARRLKSRRGNPADASENPRIAPASRVTHQTGLPRPNGLAMTGMFCIAGAFLSITVTQGLFAGPGDPVAGTGRQPAGAGAWAEGARNPTEVWVIHFAGQRNLRAEEKRPACRQSSSRRLWGLKLFFKKISRFGNSACNYMQGSNSASRNS